MADVELVIKIDEEDYRTIKNRSVVGDLTIPYVFDAIRNGALIQKGHGRIGDLDKLIKAMKNRNEDNGGEPLNAVDRGYDLAYQHMTEEVKECVIIEADKGVSE